MPPRKRPTQANLPPNLDPLGPDDKPEGSPVGETPDSEAAFDKFPSDEYEAVMVTTPGVTERKQGPTPPEDKIIQNPERTAKPEAKSGPPSLDEWQDFIGRFVIRGLTEGYLSLVLSDVEAEMSPRELASIRLTQEDLKEMAAPIASLAHKSKFARRKGRAVIAAADSMESVIAMVLWMRRVNKIAKKYRKPKNSNPVQGYVMEGPNDYGNSRPDGEQGPGNTGTGFGVFNPGSGG